MKSVSRELLLVIMIVLKAMGKITIVFIIDVSTCIFLLGDFHFENAISKIKLYDWNMLS